MSMHMAAPAPPFRFRIVPVLTVVALALGLPWLAGELVDFARHYSRLVPGIADQLGWLYAQHGVQMVLALIAIAVMKWLVPADYGLHAPEDKSYVGTAILWGLLFGALMAVVRSAPDLLDHAMPKLDYPLSPANVAGRLGFEGVYAGPTEEILFRSLLATFLAATMPGRWRIGKYAMNGSGVVVAIVYALCSAGFLAQPIAIASGQMVCYLALGVLYAYWLEKSGSVLAPIVGRNVAGFTEYALLFLMVTFWR